MPNLTSANPLIYNGDQCSSIILSCCKCLALGPFTPYMYYTLLARGLLDLPFYRLVGRYYWQHNAVTSTLYYVVSHGWLNYKCYLLDQINLMLVSKVAIISVCCFRLMPTAINDSNASKGIWNTQLIYTIKFPYVCRISIAWMFITPVADCRDNQPVITAGRPANSRGNPSAWTHHPHAVLIWFRNPLPSVALCHVKQHDMGQSKSGGLLHSINAI